MKWPNMRKSYLWTKGQEFLNRWPFTALSSIKKFPWKHKSTFHKIVETEDGNYIKSRRQFVEEVAFTLDKNHASQLNESFIFGISGKWGEGKTYFLQDVKRKLKEINDDYEVIELNPWKYGLDKVSFLRVFLKELRRLDKRGGLRKFVFGDEFQSLYSDVTSFKVNPIPVATVTIAIAATLGAFYLLPASTFNFFDSLSPILTLLALPLLIPFLGSFFTSQKSNKAITTIEKFDDFFGRILKRIKDKKVIVFLDDLDRVSPVIAREVLDNLRTFFDEPKISFIVTGDHSVLERHLGRDLLPENPEPAQLAEGRRFLKKIFNVYWRLPLPLDAEVDFYVQSVFKKHDQAIDSIFNASDKNTLQRYLRVYFEKNLRQIERFIETIIFTFRVIEAKKVIEEDKARQLLETVTKNPLLLVRVLLIEELCTPLFEEMLHNPELLSELEYVAAKEDVTQIESIVSRQEGMLVQSQISILKRLLSEQPGFHNGKSYVVQNVRPFLYLAADASFGDERGPKDADFLGLLRQGDSVGLKDMLADSGEPRLQSSAQVFVALTEETGDTLVKKSIIDTAVNALLQLSPDHEAHKIFSDRIKNINLDFYEEIGSAQKMPSVIGIWKWLSALDTDSELVNYFSFRNFNDVEQISAEVAHDVFAGKVLVSWFNTAYVQDRSNTLRQFKKFIAGINKELLSNEINWEILKDDFYNDDTQDLREIRLEILSFASPEVQAESKLGLLSKISERLDDSLWYWATEKIGQGTAFWTQSEMENNILNKYKDASDGESILRLLRFANQRFSEKGKSAVWNQILSPNTVKLFLNVFPQIARDTSFRFVAPNPNEALRLREAIVERVNEQENEGEAMQWAEYLKKDAYWYWEKMNKRIFKKDLLKLNKKAFLENKVTEVLNSWAEA